MYPLTMSPALAVSIGRQQTLEAVEEARRAHRARLARPNGRRWVRRARPGARSALPGWRRGLQGRAAS